MSLFYFFLIKKFLEGKKEREGNMTLSQVFRVTNVEF